jgi:hypothetical protein
MGLLDIGETSEVPGEPSSLPAQTLESDKLSTDSIAKRARIGKARRIFALRPIHLIHLTAPTS